VKRRVIPLSISAATISIKAQLTLSLIIWSPTEATVAKLMSKNYFSFRGPNWLIVISAQGGTKLHPVTVQFLNHPEEKEILARELQTPLID
jgi:hypothetical protein